MCCFFALLFFEKKTPKICQLYWHFFVSDVVYVSYDADLLFTQLCTNFVCLFWITRQLGSCVRYPKEMILKFLFAHIIVTVLNYKIVVLQNDKVLLIFLFTLLKKYMYKMTIQFCVCEVMHYF